MRHFRNFCISLERASAIPESPLWGKVKLICWAAVNCSRFRTQSKTSERRLATVVWWTVSQEHRKCCDRVSLLDPPRPPPESNATKEKLGLSGVPAPEATQERPTSDFSSPKACDPGDHLQESLGLPGSTKKSKRVFLGV